MVEPEVRFIDPRSIFAPVSFGGSRYMSENLALVRYGPNGFEETICQKDSHTIRVSKFTHPEHEQIAYRVCHTYGVEPTFVSFYTKYGELISTQFSIPRVIKSIPSGTLDTQKTLDYLANRFFQSKLDLLFSYHLAPNIVSVDKMDTSSGKSENLATCEMSQTDETQYVVIPTGNNGKHEGEIRVSLALQGNSVTLGLVDFTSGFSKKLDLVANIEKLVAKHPVRYEDLDRYI